MLLVHLLGVTARAAEETNFTWTGHYRPFWGVDVGIEGAFKANVHAVVQNSLSSEGAWLRHYSVTSVKLELPLSYLAYAVPPEPDPPIPPPISEDYLVTLESSDFDLTYHSPPIVGFGPGSFVIEAYSPAQGYSLYIFLGHPRRQVFSTPKGATLIIGGTSHTPPDAFVLTVGSGVTGVGGVGQWPSASNFLYPVGYDWTHLPPAWGIPDWPDNWFAVQCRAFQDDDIWASLSLHRVTYEGLVADTPSDIDAPLMVKPDAAILARMPPLGLGVVADGVTPVLLKIEAHPLTTTTYRIVLDSRTGSVDLSNKISVLSEGAFKLGTTISLSPTSTSAFAYIQGIDRQDLTLGADNEVVVGVSLQTLDGKSVATTHLGIRRPPVVLVHGIGSTAKWEFSQPFLDWMYRHYPKDFVLPIEYGVSGPDHDDPTLNIRSPLIECARLLHGSLLAALESPTATIRQSWAFTRYDIVGHSQGGLILRYLAQPQPLGLMIPAFCAPENLHRGRFDRLITIGSPHNGSLNYFYMNATCRLSPFPLDKLATLWFDNDGNHKFDPFGREIESINSPYFVTDPAARFHCIRSTIYDGRPPGEADRPCPKGYWVLDHVLPEDRGLRSLYKTLWPEAPDIPASSPLRKGHFVLPVGSDGVVDFDSQRGGCTTNVTDLRELTKRDFAHLFYFWKMNPGYRVTFEKVWMPEIFPRPLGRDLFGVKDDSESQIDSAHVADTVCKLLREAKTAFGPFQSAIPRPTALKETIEALIKAGVGKPPLFLDALQQTPGTWRISVRSSSAPPVKGSMVWSAVHFGVAGLDLDGFILEPDATGGTSATLKVTPALIGDIAVAATYQDAAGETLVTVPLRAYRNDGGASLVGISLVIPNQLLRTGQTVPFAVSGAYSDGSQRLLFAVPDDGFVYESSDTNVSILHPNGIMDALRSGSCNVTVRLGTLSGMCTVTVVPANDDFLQRETLIGRQAAGSNRNATKEEMELNHAGNAGGHSVWYEWLAPIRGAVVIDTIGSDFDTLLAVYQGDALNRLTTVSSDRGSATNGASRLTFQAAAGAKYAIAVDGANGASGNLMLNVDYVGGEMSLKIYDPKIEGNTFSCSVVTQSLRTYTLQFKELISDEKWMDGHTMGGNGSTIVLTNRCDAIGGRFYRIQAQ